MIKQIRQFIKEVKGEFKKVTWPTKEQTYNQTGVVLFVSGLTAIFLGAIDYGLSEAVKLVIG